MHLISQCPQLRELDLSFTAGWNQCHFTCRRHNSKEPLQTLSFEPVFACKELQKLNLDAENMVYVLDSKADIDQEKETVWDMRQWFADKFAARGKKVEV